MHGSSGWDLWKLRVDFLHRAEHRLVEKLRARDAASHYWLEADGGQGAETAEGFLDEADRGCVIRQSGDTFLPGVTSHLVFVG
jgi:hypothetical protein